MTDISIEPNTKTITIGGHTLIINHPTFWKYFGYGTAIAGAIVAVYVTLSGG